MSGNALEGGGHCHSLNQITPSQKSCCSALRNATCEPTCLYRGAQSRDVYAECSASNKGVPHTRSYGLIAQPFEVAESA